MKKTPILLASVAIVAASCSKFDKDGGDSMIAFAARYGQTVTVPNSDYQLEEVNALSRTSDDMPYTGGEVKFLINGNEVAKINYSHGNDYQAMVTKDGSSEVVTLGEDKEGKWDYKKIIVEPLVYSEACGYVVSGIIKFYKDEQWVATFDYGDGTCDNLIAKTTKDYENYMFSMDDYPDWNN